ncbi:MAG: FadR family transcriptional regulator [Alphaproteobacteria bacterium]|nr:FadR family transcriptional regulator [Alphaproteobacteria bacterium]
MKPEKAAQVIARQIKQAVLSGELAIGDKLPGERELIAQSGYSRSVVREALRLLEDDGLIVLQAGRNGGAVVSNPNTSQIMSNIDMHLRLQQTGVREVHEAQRVIEPVIVKLAIEKATEEDFGKIRETIELIERNPEDIDLVRIQSNRFHTLLGEATKNNVLAIVAGILRQIVVDFRYEGDAKEALAIARIHRRILEAIEAKDVEKATRRALRHVNASEAVMCSRSN